MRGTGSWALGVMATGAALAEHFGRWSDQTLQLKLMLVVVVGVLIVFHAITPRSRGLSIAVFAGSIAILWLGVSLSH